MIVYNCRDMFGIPDDDQADPLDAATHVESQDPRCYSDHWHDVVDDLPPIKRAAYLSDDTNLTDWSRIEWDIATRVLHAYDTAHPWQPTA